MRGIAVTYHYVRDTAGSEFPGIKALSISDFEAQLDYLQERFDVVEYDRLAAILEGSHAPARPFAALTFDDGFVDHAEHVAPILERRGLRGIFFVAGDALRRRALLNVHKSQFLLARLGADRFREMLAEWIEETTDTVGRDGIYRYDESPDLAVKRLVTYELPFDVTDRALDELFEQEIGDVHAFAAGLYLTEATMRRMAENGHAFGWHTHSHPVMSRLPREAQRRQLKGGASVLADVIPRSGLAFCYPYGHRHTYDDHTLQALDELGYRMAFTVVRAPLTTNRRTSGWPFELPRVDCRDLPPYAPHGPFDGGLM